MVMESSCLSRRRRLSVVPVPAPVKFLLTGVSDTSAVFENPEHNFPKKITYLLEDGNLHAYIEGHGKDGNTKKIDFYFNKMR